MKHLLLSGFFVIIGMSVFAQSQPGYDGIQAIKEIHDGWLIIRLPGFEKKLTALDSILANNGLSEKARRRYESERSRTLKSRDLIYKWYPMAFDSVYAFSRYAIIYTHETEGFQRGDIPARGANGEQLDSVFREKYFFATLRGIADDPFRFTTKDNQLLLFPFPNNIGMPGFVFPGITSEPLPEWLLSEKRDRMPIYRVYRHVLRVNRKLSSFYTKWYESDRK